MENIYISDICVIGIIIFFAFLGFKKGFVNSIIGLLSLFVSIVVASILQPFGADILTSLGIRDVIYSGVIEKLMISGAEFNSGNVFIPKQVATAVFNAKSSFISATGNALTDIIIRIVSFIVVLILVRIVIFVVTRVLKVITKAPIISSINKLLGLAVGLIKGVAVVYILLIVCVMIIPISENSKIESDIKSSYIASKIYNTNPLVKLYIDN